MNYQSTKDGASLKGKFALVTGSSRGIGRGIALKLAEKGATVAINYLKDEAAAHDTLSKIQERGAEGMVIKADVSKPEELTTMLNRVHEKFGELDILINNALGDLIGFMSPPLKVTLNQWDDAFQVQSRAFLVAVQHVADYMRNNGRIVSISYWPGSHMGGFLPYFAMGTNKAALEAMCRYFAVALAPKGITVNTICAGITDDSIVNHLPKEAEEAMLSWLRQGWNPMGRPGTPADIGGAVATLCSDEAGWITGQTIVADGGATLMNPEVPLDFQRP
jgi:enoyl-[acyl-carrier protein] reductase III